MIFEVIVHQGHALLLRSRISCIHFTSALRIISRSIKISCSLDKIADIETQVILLRLLLHSRGHILVRQVCVGSKLRWMRIFRIFCPLSMPSLRGNLYSSKSRKSL